MEQTEHNSCNHSKQDAATMDYLSTDSLRIYFNLCIIKYFLDIISPNNDMLAKLRWLFVDFPEIDLAAMGFPKGWEMEPIWK